MTGYSFIMEEETIWSLLSGLAAGIPTSLLNLAGYVLTAMALYTLAQRRGLNKPWLAWVPVVNVWLLGSLSDQYQYVVHGQDKSKRKWLLGLSVATTALTAVLSVSLVTFLVGTITGMMGGASQSSIAGDGIRTVLGMAGLALPMAAVSIAYAVIRFMALYDVYRSIDPGNATVFLVLSILFGVTEPFFLFFCRNKDQGMPPRRQQEPVFTAGPEDTVRQEPVFTAEPEPDYTAKRETPYWGEAPQESTWEKEPWNAENKDYL